jgi:RHS repeat-associated protein
MLIERDAHRHSPTGVNAQAECADTQPNQDHRLVSIESPNPNGFIAPHHFYYSPAGDITQWDNWTGNCWRGINPPQNFHDTCAGPAQNFTYDSADQLTGVTQTSTRSCLFIPCKPKNPKTKVVKRTAYTYDRDGNRTSEQIDDPTPGGGTSFTGASHDAMNRLESTQPAGLMTFAGTLSEPASVTVGAATNQAAGQWTGAFTAAWMVSPGINSVAITATDNGSPANVTTNNYQVNVSGPAAAEFVYDDNGNLLADGARIYEWDTENRLTAVVVGSHRSEFVYDGFSRRVEIIEKDNGSVASDHHFIWCGASICEERDANGTTVVRRYYSDGIQDGGANYFYHRDHLGSVREVTDNTGAVVARYDFDPFGRRTQTEGTYNAPNGYTGHWTHKSGLVLTLYRAYDPNIGRWLSEDPIGLKGGINYYHYGNNNPINIYDPLGLLDIYVIIWNQEGTSVGHAAAFEEDGGLILSEYPSTGTTNGINMPLDLQQTLAKEERDPDYAFKVHINDENVAAFRAVAKDRKERLWWNWLPTTKNETNCVEAVAAALTAGGIPVGKYRWPGNLGSTMLDISNSGSGTYIPPIKAVPFHEIPGSSSGAHK